MAPKSHWVPKRGRKSIDSPGTLTGTYRCQCVINWGSEGGSGLNVIDTEQRLQEDDLADGYDTAFQGAYFCVYIWLMI